ncbi:MAG: CheY-like chemotaxis protein [Bradymonadia bacterium]|jgi:CheY-like chemotaxis protein
MTELLIYVVDDHPINRRLMKAVLKRLKYTAKTADGGESMRALLEEQLPGVILMDLRMPGEDGIELTRWLKANPVTAAIPVIAITADLVRASRAAAMDAGCVAFVGKPIDAKALDHTIAAYTKPR